MLVGLERGDGDVLAVGGARVPAVFDGQRVARFHGLALHGRREHAAGAPAPDGAAEGVENDEVVGLAVGETELDCFGGVVGDAEGEIDVFAVLAGGGDDI